MNFPFFIARRYLFAKKSHNVINVVSAISAAGMAVGTAALIIILSVYNGFDSLVKSMMGTVEPDLLISASEGKVFVPEGELYDWIYEQQSVASMCTVLEEQVFMDYDGKQEVAVAKGVDSIYEEESPLSAYVRDGEYSLHRGDVPLALVGVSLAHRMGVNPRFLTPLRIYYPTRTRRISAADPLGSIRSVNVWPSATFAVSSEVDGKYLILPIEKMRELLEYDDEVSGVEIRFVEGTSAQEMKRVEEGIAGIIADTGAKLKVADRFRQNETLYRMMKYEKAAIFLILLFVVIIIAFNIFGSLSMLIIEKRSDVTTLRSMGADDRLVRRIFVLEGWLISLTGMAAGLLLGVAFVILQQHFGLISMPSGFVVSAYPVELHLSDFLLTVAGVSVIGYITAMLPVASFLKKEKRGA